jgi:hypothetical protein
MNCSILIVPLFPVGGGFIRPETETGSMNRAPTNYLSHITY